MNFAPFYNKRTEKSGNVLRIKSSKLSPTENKIKYINGTIGLFNLGNTCYLNSSIQNLKNIYPLTLYLLSNYALFDINGFTYKYCTLIANLINQEKTQFVEPNEFVNKLCESEPTFILGQQNDSNICIITILNLLEKETKRFNNSKKLNTNRIFNLNNEENEKFKLFLNKLNEERNSFIIDYFSGFQEEIYQCNFCNYRNYTFKEINILNLSIMTRNNNSIKTLKDAIQYYQYEQLYYNEADFTCTFCSNHKITTRSIFISLPNILITNIKRIGDEKNDFYKHNIIIPDILEINKIIANINCKYELTGFIKHIMEAKSWHNIAICKNFFDNRWYEYNDSDVKSLNNSQSSNNYYNSNEIDTSDGFLFFYKKKEDIISEYEKDIIINKSLNLRKYF